MSLLHQSHISLSPAHNPSGSHLTHSKSQRPHHSLQSPGLISSLTSSPPFTPCNLCSHTGLLKHTSCTPASGPLHKLFLLSGTPLSSLSGLLFHLLQSLLTCYLLSQAVSDLFKKLYPSPHSLHPFFSLVFLCSSYYSLPYSRISLFCLLLVSH